METNEPAKQPMKWWIFLLIGGFMLLVGFGITDAYSETSVMWNVGGGIQLVAWGFVITSIIKAVKGKKK